MSKELIEAKNGFQAAVEVFNKTSLPSRKLNTLATSYAVSFWAGVWKELVCERDINGRVVSQFGTRDQSGTVYRDTRDLLSLNEIDISNPSWPLILWERAGNQTLVDSAGTLLEQFWTMQSAAAELMQFLQPVEENGYGGEFIILTNEGDNPIGFTAYTVGNITTGAQLAQKRFPYEYLCIPETRQTISMTLSERLQTLYSGLNIGTFLDFAIAEDFQGNGLGSIVFDMRINRLIELGADVIVGRTLKTSPAQYYGNYIARGMKPIAIDPENPDKVIFAVTKDQIKQRTKR